MPGAADAVAGLDDEVVVESFLIELDGGADAREPSADDQAVVVGPIAAHHYLHRGLIRRSVVTDGTAPSADPKPPVTMPPAQRKDEEPGNWI